jgi:5-oxoprolinase (ATP-hydrolysing)
MQDHKWQFWIDRGGTFTDIVARTPDGKILTHKLLSENPDHYIDAPVQGIRDLLKLSADQPLPVENIAVIKMGTTVATNALLERTGQPPILLITKGLRDLLRIGYQNRPNIFAREIILPAMLYSQVIEVEERITATGEILIPLNIPDITTKLQNIYNQGFTNCAIALMHSYRYPDHEKQVGAIARQIGFRQISISHQVSPLMKLVSRGHTTVVDAYLSPVLKQYVAQVTGELLKHHAEHQENLPPLLFMQSHGGLVAAEKFQGKDSILSGPAGGIVGAVKTSIMAGFPKIISFDMGGTSTDVAHYAGGVHGEYERQLDTNIAGVYLQTPILAIHTVAAGGGSILSFDGDRYLVGPESAGANPGPACYGKGGPLTVTDCNVLLGKIQPQFFPQVFGKNADQPLDKNIVETKFQVLTEKIADQRTPALVATGFLTIAVEKMANAIKKISLAKGYDVATYTLCCFGGAGGQHACLIADALGMSQIFIHPLAGVLSAYGIGLADQRVIKEQAIETILNQELLDQLPNIFDELAYLAKQEMNPAEQDQLLILRKLNLKYQGSDAIFPVDYSNNLSQVINNFDQQHQQRYGFLMPEKSLLVASVYLELINQQNILEDFVAYPEVNTINHHSINNLNPVATVPMFTGNQWHNTPVYLRENLLPGTVINSPALIIESTGTNVIEIGWSATVTANNYLILQRNQSDSDAINQQNHQQIASRKNINLSQPDPVFLEIFNNRFRAIAEQMGVTLQNTSSSVNIKERLDFSCAIFDPAGQLVANAPHIPVHLGSMGASVVALINYCQEHEPMHKGDVYVSNNPYNGGTHLPDITVITPVFLDEYSHDQPIFYLAARGHHADIGGITAGSMPPHSSHIREEGILLDNFLLVKQGQLRLTELTELLTAGVYPARNIAQNIADLQAQIAANNQGSQELQKLVNDYGLPTVLAYMQFVQDQACHAVQRAIARLVKEVNQSEAALYQQTAISQLDNGSMIQVNVKLDATNQTAIIDFTGTSPQLNNNFNAPLAVCQAAVLYVFRTLVDDDIPLNAGCLQPLTIIVPPASMLYPQYPAAVVAGNVETSQVITDTLYQALGIMANSQGTMNNFTFGNAKYQYYETICGGSGAGKNYHGTDAVHTHMTNSRLTDPEVLEWHFPVVLKSFRIRPDSGGNGKYQGGNGVIREIQFLQTMTANILSNHRLFPPAGVAGGEAGKVGKNYVIRTDKTIENLHSTATTEMAIGDIFVIETPGGGGYGCINLDPAEKNE